MSIRSYVGNSRSLRRGFSFQVLVCQHTCQHNLSAEPYIADSLKVAAAKARAEQVTEVKRDGQQTEEEVEQEVMEAAIAGMKPFV